MGFFERLKEGLSKTRRNFTDRIQELVGLSAAIDDDFLDELEMILLSADVGVKTTEKLIDAVRKAAKKKEISGTEDVIPFLKKYMAEKDVELLNSYHKDVYEKISPYLDEEEKEWLKEATRPVSK